MKLLFSQGSVTLLVAGKSLGFAVEMDGFEQLFYDLDNMGAKGEKSVSKALRAGGDVFLKYAQANVNYSKRKSDKHLKDALRVSYVKLNDAGDKYVSIGTYLGRGKYRNGVYWGHILEGGHWIIVKGKARGYVTARPFMQPAYDRGKDEATKAMADIVFDAMGLKK